MGILLDYHGEDKVKKRIADVLNVTDVQANGTSVVDANGIAHVSEALPLTVQNGKLCIIYDDGQ